MNMKNKEQFLEKLQIVLEKGKGRVIEDAYIGLILKTLTGLTDDELNLSDEMLIELLDIIEAVINKALSSTDQSKVAAMLMARLSGAKSLTIAHVNIIITTIGLTFKHGNQILYNVSKYNSHINNICLEQINTLAQLADTRRQAQTDETKRREDIDTVADLIIRQFATL